MTREQAEAVVADLRALCAKHGVILAGSCYSEGIAGEITSEAVGESIDRCDGYNVLDDFPECWSVRGVSPS